MRRLEREWRWEEKENINGGVNEISAEGLAFSVLSSTVNVIL